MSGMHIIIIGNGISGITAARHVRKRSLARITVISGESSHFFSRTALMYVYMGHMRKADIKPYADDFWPKNRIELVQAWVNEVRSGNKQVLLADGTVLEYDKLVIATGSVPNKFGWPGQDLPGVQGLYSMQDLEAMERDTRRVKRAVVVGGGLIGMEMVEMLCSRKIPVTFLVRDRSFWGDHLPLQEAELIGRHIMEHRVDLRCGTELAGIVPGADGRVCGVRTNSGEEIACEFVGLTTGVSPNIAWLAGTTGIATGRGVLVNEFLETSATDVYAIGDCAEFHQNPDPERGPIEQVWYTGRMMGETVALSLTGQRTSYRPGVWFNSSKFFDIEYQTYGWVRKELRDGESDHYWEHRSGRQALRVVWDTEDRIVKGVHAFGIRLRHEVLDRYITQGTTVDHLMSNFREASFDPEFHGSTIRMVQDSFKERNRVSV